jgi:Ca2+-transporting ATPase
MGSDGRDTAAAGVDSADPSEGLAVLTSPGRPTRDGRSSAIERIAGGGADSGLEALLDQDRTYMQLILRGAAIVSFAVKEWSTGVLLVVLTASNAVVGCARRARRRVR